MTRIFMMNADLFQRRGRRGTMAQRYSVRVFLNDSEGTAGAVGNTLLFFNTEIYRGK